MLRDDDQKSAFMGWLGEHGSSVMQVARAYTLTIEECQDQAQEILFQAWRTTLLRWLFNRWQRLRHPRAKASYDRRKPISDLQGEPQRLESIALPAFGTIYAVA